MTALYDVLKADTNDATKLALIADFDRVLSLNLIEGANALQTADETPKADDALESYVAEQIAARAAAKKAKNYAEADRIRDELKQKGITLTDTPQGTKWSVNA